MQTTESTQSIPVTKGVFVVDDHDVVRIGAAQLISKEPDLRVCGEAASVSEAIPLIRVLHPDVILVDISLKNSNGLEMIKVVRAENPEIPLLVMSMHDEAIWAEVALRAGAAGYIMKESSVENLIPALRSVLAGKVYLSHAVSDRIIRSQITHRHSTEKAPLERLSDRELQVLTLLGQWKNAREIATELGLSIKTVEYYKQNIKDKLHLKTGAELNHFAVEFAKKHDR